MPRKRCTHAAGIAVAVSLASLASAVRAGTGPGQPLSIDELDAVHAAGLSDEVLHPRSDGAAQRQQRENTWAVAVMMSEAVAQERQRALEQLRLAAGAAQAGVVAVQNLSTLSILPAAPVTAIPAFGMPFPFTMPPPPASQDGKH